MAELRYTINRDGTLEKRPADKYIGVCARCGCEGLKKNMTAIYAKKDSYSPVRILCHICADCYAVFLEELGITEG